MMPRTKKAEFLFVPAGRIDDVGFLKQLFNAVESFEHELA